MSAPIHNIYVTKKLISVCWYTGWERVHIITIDRSNTSNARRHLICAAGERRVLTTTPVSNYSFKKRKYYIQIFYRLSSVHHIIIDGSAGASSVSGIGRYRCHHLLYSLILVLIFFMFDIFLSILKIFFFLLLFVPMHLLFSKAILLMFPYLFG